jgi:hypothetical protein
LDACILRSIKWCVEVEVGLVQCHELRTWCRECVFDDNLDSFEQSGFGAAITHVVDCVPADGDAGAVWVCLCWSYFTDNFCICHIGYAFAWDVAEHDGAHFVCTCDSLLIWECWMFPDALAEASDFIGV